MIFPVPGGACFDLCSASLITGRAHSMDRTNAMPIPLLALIPVCLAGLWPATSPSAGAAQDPASSPVRLDFSPGGPIPDSQLGDFHVELECKIEEGPSGTLAFEFWPEAAPVTVRNFLRYSAEGLYDGLTFHRVLREFMVQGGDPLGNGTGKGTYGTIPDEFSKDPRRGHGYGVISMANSGPKNSASCQFFVCTADSANVFQLDGKHAAFGKLVSGVALLEAIASTPTVRDATGTLSRPSKKITIVKASVARGPSATRETIERPQPDCGGQPLKVDVQHILVSFAGAPTSRATRTKEEAEALAKQVLERARAGEDFDDLVRSSSDATLHPLANPPGMYRLLNRGAFDVQSERARMELSGERERRSKALEERYSKGEIDGETLGTESESLRKEIEARVGTTCYQPRSAVVQGFADAAFALQPGEIALVPWDAELSPYGWHVIRRLR